MNIFDLNHVETVSSESQVLGGFYENDYINFDVYGDTFIFTHIDGNTAQVDGGAEAYGSDTYTKVAGGTYTDPHTSESSLFSISVSDSDY